jgi:hypothetical protein
MTRVETREAPPAVETPPRRRENLLKHLNHGRESLASKTGRSQQAFCKLSARVLRPRLTFASPIEQNRAIAVARMRADPAPGI